MNAEIDPFLLPIPSDKRLRVITDLMTENPSDSRGLYEFSKIAGGSSRTLARLFLKETGLTFGNWRKRLRIIKAIEMLRKGSSITTIALEVGYNSPSAFIVMFKHLVGTSPKKYFYFLNR